MVTGRNPQGTVNDLTKGPRKGMRKSKLLCKEVEGEPKRSPRLEIGQKG
jgi:hypothetical protein